LGDGTRSTSPYFSDPGTMLGHQSADVPYPLPARSMSLRLSFFEERGLYCLQFWNGAKRPWSFPDWLRRPFSPAIVPSPFAPLPKSLPGARSPLLKVSRAPVQPRANAHSRPKIYSNLKCNGRFLKVCQLHFEKTLGSPPFVVTPVLSIWFFGLPFAWRWHRVRTPLSLIHRTGPIRYVFLRPRPYQQTIGGFLRTPSDAVASAAHAPAVSHLPCSPCWRRGVPLRGLILLSLLR